MRLIATKHLQPATELGRSIYNDNGQVLIRQGVKLTQRMIDRLIDYGITYVYIRDGLTEDLTSQYPISEELRMTAVHTIKESFSKVADEDNLDHGYLVKASGKKIKGVVQTLLTEMKGQKEVISLLSDVITYDDYIFTHSLNVSMYALALGSEMNLPNRKLEEIGIGAILHDIGKTSVPRHILLKPDKLEEHEFEQIKKHTEAGFEALRKSESIPLVAAHCAYQHHERLNGSGYPRGITGEDIHLYGKILAIADVFDAVTSNRAYRSAMLPHEGLEILYAGADELFDKKMVEAFRRCIAIYPNGLTVELSDGRKGIVTEQNQGLCDRPFVRIFLEANGQSPERYYEADLAKELNVVVTKCDTTYAS
ncbi:HD-GYP domain-containing protein [Thalassobacillus sp. CUG 92003]|uniref:HD-GYP domain-containing protein n=1 Tax=Thalassobacillus sp. CUG 92003 TaxID=2736641 RepID=UPI0015E71B54|nr:HD-GYP domain-containing protein [Thalassobacillus sp. CUG 92003]